MTIPQGKNQRWSLDFVSDAMTDGRRFRILTVVDDITRECLALVADTSLSGLRVARELDALIARRDKPLMIVSDNGPEFISKELDIWAFMKGITLDFSRPGKPTDNAFIESLNGKFRAECLNVSWFMSLDEAREKCEDWRRDYNMVRQHSAIGNQVPARLHLPVGSPGQLTVG
ncbi:MAG: transposase family protein [Alphaproteobacteria bacterium]|nr:transposase family protein [Alphaproteobacteria bacterium]